MFGQSKENNGHETGQKSPERERIKQNANENILLFYETHEPWHQFPNKINDKVFFTLEKSTLREPHSLSVSLFSVITPFEGDARKFKQWIKKPEKYSVMYGKQNH